VFFFGFGQYTQELARLGSINKKADGASISSTSVIAVNPRGMFVTRTNFHLFIDVLLVHGINLEFKASKLNKYGDMLDM
jgi:hypothetical protein